MGNLCSANSNSKVASMPEPCEVDLFSYKRTANVDNEGYKFIESIRHKQLRKEVEKNTRINKAQTFAWVLAVVQES
jgi:hypothetical protein